MLTNFITNGLLAITILFYTLSSAIQWLEGNKKFTGFIVLYFLSFLVLSLLATLAHYLAKDTDNSAPIWFVISLGIIFFNYCLIYAIKVHDFVRVLVIFFSLVCIYYFHVTGHFLFIASASMLIYLLAAIYSKGLTRLGFITVVISNLFWLALRAGTNLVLGYAVPIQYRYDNDIYHFLLIISTFIVYKSIVRGDWSYP
jgi:hypothetical protein